MFKTVIAMLRSPVFSYEKHVDWKLSLSLCWLRCRGICRTDRMGQKKHEILFVDNTAPLALQLHKNKIKKIMF